MFLKLISPDPDNVPLGFLELKSSSSARPRATRSCFSLEGKYLKKSPLTGIGTAAAAGGGAGGGGGGKGAVIVGGRATETGTTTAAAGCGGTGTGTVSVIFPIEAVAALLARMRVSAPSKCLRSASVFDVISVLLTVSSKEVILLRLELLEPVSYPDRIVALGLMLLILSGRAISSMK